VLHRRRPDQAGDVAVDELLVERGLEGGPEHRVDMMERGVAEPATADPALPGISDQRCHISFGQVRQAHRTEARDQVEAAIERLVGSSSLRSARTSASTIRVESSESS
jgi:hypothetical protein